MGEWVRMQKKQKNPNARTATDKAILRGILSTPISRRYELTKKDPT
jgi:hypothetical protein